MAEDPAGGMESLQISCMRHPPAENLQRKFIILLNVKFISRAVLCRVRKDIERYRQFRHKKKKKLLIKYYTIYTYSFIVRKI